MKPWSRVKQGWESRFPDLFGKWTHWMILGDGSRIAVVEGSNLVEALALVYQHYGQYATIKACRATVDANGELLEEEKKALFEISNYLSDQKLLGKDRRTSNQAL